VTLLRTALAAAAAAAAVTAVCSTAFAQNALHVAEYSADGELLYPSDAYAWIQTAASVGSDYNDNPIDPENPGTIGVVQMEPNAYKYFMEHKQYADGTMFLLSFYRPQRKSEPQLQGFVQGELIQREIHVIDKQRFKNGQGHAFFVYRDGVKSAPALGPASPCVACHVPNGKFDGTFAQFYPDIRAKLGL
jgi:hypothetical protein